MALLLPALAIGALLLFSSKPKGSKDNTAPSNFSSGQAVYLEDSVVVDVGPDISDVDQNIIFAHVIAAARQQDGLLFHIASSTDEGVAVSGDVKGDVQSYFGYMGDFKDNFALALHYALTGEELADY